jgi:hypothetical protein
MASAPVFTGTPRISIGQITAAADTSFTSPTTNGVIVFQAAAGGSRLHRIDICALMTTTAGMINLFWYDGSNYRAWKSVKVDAITVAAGTAPFQATLLFPEGIPVPGGSGFDRLYASSYTGDDFNVIAYGGDL